MDYYCKLLLRSYIYTTMIFKIFTLFLYGIIDLRKVILFKIILYIYFSKYYKHLLLFLLIKVTIGTSIIQININFN